MFKTPSWVVFLSNRWWKLLNCKPFLTKLVLFAGSLSGAGRLILSHGACHCRGSASAGISRCRRPAAVSDTYSPQTRSFSAGCCGGHHGGQLWPGERSASVMWVSVVVQMFALHCEPELCFLCVRVCTSLSRCWSAACAVWTWCCPPAAGGSGAYSKFDWLPTAGLCAANSLRFIPL